MSRYPLCAPRKGGSRGADGAVTSPAFYRVIYRRRSVIERLVEWLKEHRRIATRFEKLGSSYMAAVKLPYVRRY